MLNCGTTEINSSLLLAPLFTHSPSPGLEREVEKKILIKLSILKIS